jgi:hypothetical protein
MRYSRALLRIALFAALAAGCEASGQWGTPQYFERITGVAFVPNGRVIRCQQETGFDYVAFRQVRLPQSAIDILRRQPSMLAAFPHQLEYERERRLARWARVPLGPEAQEALDLALSGAVAAIEESRCGALASIAARESVLRAIERPTTFYSYQLLAPEGQILPEALDFRLLDLEAGVLFELVNFS